MIVDCRNMTCPLPLIETRKALKSYSTGDIIEIQLNNETSFTNISQFLKDHNIQYKVIRTNELISIEFIVPENIEYHSPIEDYCRTLIGKQMGNYIVVLNSAFMGKGNDDLGKLLLKGFLSSLSELNELPTEIICYNSAVTLAINGTDTSLTLTKLSNLGVKVSLCGTCIDFFGVKETIAVGKITNMMDIAQKITTSNVVQP